MSTSTCDLESLTDGIVVDGTICAPVARHVPPLPRRRVRASSRPRSHELYQQVVTDPDAFEIVGDQLDLAPMVREVVLLDAPATPLCRPDCAGLCPTCGIDRNAEPVLVRVAWRPIRAGRRSTSSEALVGAAD